MLLDGDINPFTEEPITRVDSTSWEDCSVDALYDQLYALHNRQTIALNLKNYPIYHQLESAINMIQATIEFKLNKKAEYDKQRYSE